MAGRRVPMISGHSWLLLHGTPLTPEIWDDVVALLPGSVQCPAVVPGQAATDLAAGPGPFDVVGHSFGGQVALDFALAAPERVRSLTLICSRDTPFPAFAVVAAKLRAGGPVDVETTLGRWFSPQELLAGAPLVEYARRCLIECDRELWARALDAVASYDRSAEVGRLTKPVTLIAAEHDQVSTPEAMAALASRLPHATLRVLAGAAHLSPFFDATELTRIIEQAAGVQHP
jgi:pimeloyl-ACP methyl ester carboxylesterase